MHGRCRLLATAVATASAITAASAAAQQRTDALAGIPAEMYPPPGTCRVWVDGVPPEQQPAPLDCAVAQRVAPANARVVFGVQALRTEDLAATGVDRRPVGGGIDRRPEPPGSGYPRAPDGPLPAPSTPNSYPELSANANCGDRNVDGWCDEVRLPTRMPPELPRMASAVLYRQLGRGVNDVDQWIGLAQMQMRYVDADRNSVPERVLWYDRRGTPVQIWVDADRDGFADQIGLYRGGQVVRVIGRQ